MIKLIASDMDGTLLDEHSKVPPETFELIEALREKGVHFAVSSGRRYDRLCTFFEPVRDHMDFVASNGAQVYADGKLIDREVYSHLAIRELARVIEMFDNLHLALFDRTKSFLLDDESKFVREVDIKKKIVTIRVIPGLLPDSDDEAPEGSKGGTEA